MAFVKKDRVKQLLSTIEDIACRRDKGKVVDMLILDFNKAAFYAMPHHRLLMELENYGIGADTSLRNE